MIVYNIVITFLLIVLFPLLHREYYARVAILNKITKRYKIWVHCASVGETKIALKFISQFCSMTKISLDDILLTVVTPSALKIAKKLHKETYLFPLDYFFITRVLVKKISPKALIIFETELWPNYIYFVKKFNGKIFLLNGRISNKTFIILTIFKPLLSFGYKNIDYFLLREKIDFLRFKKVGVDITKMFISGNMKYDEEEDVNANFNKTTIGFNKNDRIITFGSIREKEEKIVIEVVNKLKTVENLKFILAPRHLSLVAAILTQLDKYGICYVKRTEMNKKFLLDSVKCIVVDTLGELKKFYSICDIAFVCGSILPYGGQNIIEPASMGKVVMFGPYISNFLEPAMLLLKNNAGIMVKDMNTLHQQILDLLSNENKLKTIAENAKNLISQLKGVTQKNVEFVISKLNLV